MSSLQLASVCTLREAAELKGQLMAQLGQPGDVEIDAAQVGKVDTAGLQLLLAFVSQLDIEGRNLAWKQPNPELYRAAGQLGLVEALKLPAVEA
ncbi:MAG: hypothetical protein RLZZ200_2043 [Pseudomonadota bacterium]|jgi:ABC-type transporter Mla MlaB component